MSMLHTFLSWSWYVINKWQYWWQDLIKGYHINLLTVIVDNEIPNIFWSRYVFLWQLRRGPVSHLNKLDMERSKYLEVYLTAPDRLKWKCWKLHAKLEHDQMGRAYDNVITSSFLNQLSNNPWLDYPFRKEPSSQMWRTTHWACWEMKKTMTLYPLQNNGNIMPFLYWTCQSGQDKACIYC